MAAFDSKFNDAFVKFFDAADALVKADRKKHFPNIGDCELVAIEGKRYIKIAKRDIVKPGVYSGTYVYCFIDSTNGNVLKAEGWKKPSPIPRGNIYNADNGMGGVTGYGGRYL